MSRNSFGWCVCVSLCVFGLVLSGRPAQATSSALVNTDPWTTVGSCGIVDEADGGLYTFSNARVEMPPAAGGTLDLRYNIVSVDGLLNPLDGWLMTCRFRDNGVDARVLVRLRRLDLATGADVALMTFDSNAFAAAAGYQVQSIVDCFGFTFDFVNFAYYLHVSLIKTTSQGSPGLAEVRIMSTLC